MGQSVRNLAALLSIASSLSACAGAGGDALLRSGEYAAAISAYEAAEQASPDDGELKRNLGVAYLRAGEQDRALAKLEESRALRPDDPHVHFFLAEAYEAVGDLEGALLSYEDYLSAGGKNEISLQLRVRELARRRAAREIEAALREEGTRSSTRSDSTTLAVPDFANISGSLELAPLAKGLSAVVITDLRKVEGFRIVERERWNVLRSELELAYRGGAVADSDTSGASGATGEETEEGRAGTPAPAAPADSLPNSAEADEAELIPAFEEDESGLVDPETAPVLGRVLGAGTLVQGLFTIFGEAGIQLDAALVNVETTSTTIAGEPVVGTVPEVLQLEKQLVYHILHALGVRPTPEEREEIDGLIVNDHDNFFDYCRGLALQDQLRLQEASEVFRAVMLREPEFAHQMDLERHVSEPRRDFSALEREELEELPELGPAEPGSFLDDLVVSVGNGPGPDPGDGQEGDDATDVTVTDIEKVEQDLQSIPDFPPPPGGRR